MPHAGQRLRPDSGKHRNPGTFSITAPCLISECVNISRLEKQNCDKRISLKSEVL